MTPLDLTHEVVVDDLAVYERTAEGAHEIVFDQLSLGDAERRLLHLVNGRTPMRIFNEMLELDGDTGDDEALLHIVTAGLVRYVGRGAEEAASSGWGELPVE